MNNEKSRGHKPNENEKPKYTWEVEKGADHNYRELGAQLAEAGEFYREESGLILITADGKIRQIHRGKELIPVVIDLVSMRVTKNGKVTSELPAQHHFNTMLCTETFLGNFKVVEEVSTRPIYLDDCTLAVPGYNEQERILFVGESINPANTTETIDKFLAEMDFASNADRTNTVAAGLTCLLRRMWPGGKPAIIVTATKSHAGKGTITEFIRGKLPKAEILYEATDWPMQSQFHRLLKQNPEIGFINFDNVRLDSAGGRRANCIRSAFIESFITNEEAILACPTAGDPICGPNKFVVAINTNDGQLSPDLMNRALPIHLAPQGDIQDRLSKIGNPKYEFLPNNRDRIEAEFHGMIQRWNEAGQPLDESINHPMSPWAKTVGGILKVNGYDDFLANYGERRYADDPIKDALAILGAAKPGEYLRAREWAELAVNEGLAKTLFPPNERDTPRGRERAIGVIFKSHLNETFVAESETTRFDMKLERANRRWEGQSPHKRYWFTVLSEEQLPMEES